MDVFQIILGKYNSDQRNPTVRMPSSKSIKSSSDGGNVVKTIMSFLFLGILCSLLNRAYNPNISDLSKAEVNVEFGDSGDSITATATIKVEAPVGEQAADDQEEVGEHPYTTFPKPGTKSYKI